MRASRPAAFTLPLHVRLGWGGGSFVTSAIVFATTSFFLRYMTDYVGLGAALAGTLLAVTKIFDAFINPMMGVVSDRAGGLGSRRRRFLPIGATIAAVAMVGMFAMPHGISGNVAAVYALAMLMLSSVGYTLYNVSYLAMPAEMTPVPQERANMVSFRIYTLALTQFLVGAMAPLLLLAFGGGRDAYGAMALCLGLMIVGAGTMSFLATRSAPFTRLSRDMQTRFWTALPTIFRNRPYVVLLLIKFSFLIGSTAHTATAAFYVHHVMQASDATLGLFLTAYSIGMVLSQFLWLRMTARFGRPLCFTLAAGLYAFISILWSTMSASVPTEPFILLSALNGIGAGGILLISEAMLPDAIAADYTLNGIRREGTLASLFAFAEKASHAAGLAIVGFTLSWFGYAAPAAGQAVTGDALRGVMAAFGTVPAIFVGGSALWLLLLRTGKSARTNPPVLPATDATE